MRLLRFRYIAFQFSSDTAATVTEASFVRELQTATLQVTGRTVRDLRLRLYHFTGTGGILRCTASARKDAVAILVSIKSVGGIPVSVTTTATSGTLRTLTGTRRKGPTRSP